MDEVVDPGSNFAYEVHQYLDGDSSGTSPTIVNATVGRDRLVSFTNWARGQGARAFLGEFAVANSTIGTGPGQIGDEAITHMLDYMDDNDDVWMGWTWWGAGPWWNDYMFEIEPVNLGQPNQADRPSMDLLEPRLAGIPEPASATVLLGAGAMLALRRGRRRR
jgi:endoglucanase